MSGKLKMLLVDDSVDVRRRLLFLFKQNFSIDEVGSLSKALELIRDNVYDVVLTDGSFPQNEGGPEDFVFRGNQVAKYASATGVKLIIGLSAEPKKLNEKAFSAVFSKADIIDLHNFVLKKVNLI